MSDARGRWVDAMERELPPIRDALVLALGLDRTDPTTIEAIATAFGHAFVAGLRVGAVEVAAQTVELGYDLELNWLPPESTL
jgi:alpha-D-ribose 1-methylphosphonate 5-triphosphate synthase subunit PhnI